jgi:hypothetical protein
VPHLCVGLSASSGVSSRGLLGAENERRGRRRHAGLMGESDWVSKKIARHCVRTQKRVTDSVRALKERMMYHLGCGARTKVGVGREREVGARERERETERARARTRSRPR